MQHRQHKMFFNKFMGAGLLSGLCLILSIITAHAQSFNWVKGMGGSYADYCRAVTVDGKGNIYATGYFQSDTADFNRGGSGGKLIKMGASATGDVFLAKYDAGGNFLWTKRMGGTGYDFGLSLAVDGSDNVYIAGYFSGAPDFNPGGNGGMLNSAGGYDGFLAKYDKDGHFLWAKNMGGAGYDYSNGVAVDGSDNVYVTGYMGILVSDSVNFNPNGSGGMVKLVGGSDVFLAKYDKDGNYLWAKGMGGSGDDTGVDVAVDDSNNVYVAGHFASGKADFNIGGSSVVLTNAGKQDVFLAKYDKDGSYLWAKNMGGSSDDYCSGIAIDGSGNLYMTGYFKSATANFNPAGSGGGTLTNAGKTNVFLAKYDATGNYLWAENMGGSSNDYGQNLAVDGRGNVHITGYFTSDTAEFDPKSSGGTLIRVGSGDIFSAKYDSNGNYLWAKGMGGRNSDIGYNTRVDDHGSVYVAGMFSSYKVGVEDTVNFNPGGSGGVLTCEGVTNAFILKFSCDDTSSSYLPISVSCGEGYTLKDSLYTTAGIHTQVFTNASGCDSTVTLDLTIISLDKPVINIDDSFTLGVTGTYTTYQWLKDSSPIQGATDSVYSITENGNYQVIVTNEYGCSDTSEVYRVTNYNGIKSMDAIARQTSVYPNPVADVVYIQSPVPVRISLSTIDGRHILQTEDTTIVVKELPTGIYLLQLKSRDGEMIKVEKVIKQ